MSIAAPPSLDKSVTPREHAPREAELARTLRDARDRLTSSSGLPPRIELELLHQHTANLATGLPILAVLTSAVAGLSGIGTFQAMSVWFALNAGLAVLFLALVSRFERDARGLFHVSRWTRRFRLAHLLLGLPWAALALWPACPACGSASFEAARFATTIAAVGATAICGAALGGVILSTFLPLMAAAAYRALTDGDPWIQAASGTLVAAVPFFALVSGRLRTTLVERLRHRTERDQLVSEIETARIASDDARLRAEEANLAKSRFLATMSHELRTPLNAILGFSEVITNEILGPVGNETYKEYVGDIHSSGQHLLDLINEILDLSRVEAGRYALNEEAVDLVSIARDCMSYVQMKADAKNIAIEAKFETGLPQIWGDPRSLRQVVLNLLSNAVKFTPAGGRVVLRVGWTAGGGQYASVQDNGPGIPADEIPVVLSSFGQGSSAIKSAEQGTGLGLPIVQALIKLHNGEFELHSTPGKGTEAIAIFPHARVLEVMPALAAFD